MKTTKMVSGFTIVLLYSAVLIFPTACSEAANSDSAAVDQRRETAQQGGGIASTPTPSPEPKPSPTPESGIETKGPADVIYEYYASINSGDYRSAYELWSDNGKASKKSFEQFRDGFANTERTEVEIGKASEEEGAAGSRYITITVTIKARTKSGKDQRFTGEYVLRRSVVDGATEEQRSWQIHSASIRPR
jgi:hypothetical protein